MRYANLIGKPVIVDSDKVVDIADIAGFDQGQDPWAIFGHFDKLNEAWLNARELPCRPLVEMELGPPVPQPRQIFMVGANYTSHIQESRIDKPGRPVIFSKFPSSVVGPFDEIWLPSNSTDWEVELVIVIGRGAENVPEDRAWEHVAGVTVGQDVSERGLQLDPDTPLRQFDLGKSFPTFAPTGPVLVTADELSDRDKIRISCHINGELMQSADTSEMVFSVPELISYISRHVPMLPGDLLFTGTPGGVGLSMKPQRFLRDGDELVSAIEGIGEMRNRCVAVATTEQSTDQIGERR